jgi:hypothetical protein
MVSVTSEVERLAAALDRTFVIETERALVVAAERSGLVDDPIVRARRARSRRVAADELRAKIR